jgi:hypothetical protein
VLHSAEPGVHHCDGAEVQLGAKARVQDRIPKCVQWRFRFRILRRRIQLSKIQQLKF